MDSNELPTKRVEAPRWVILLSRNFLVRIILALLFIGIPLYGLNRLFHLFPEGIWYTALWARFVRLAFTLPLIHGMYILYVRIVERRRERELNPKFLLRDGLLGVAVGAVLIATIHIILAITGNYHIAAYLGAENLIFFFYLSVISGYMEELIFRGIFFRLFEQGLGSWLAILVSSLMFGFMHATNPNASLTSSIFITLEAGFTLAGVYMFTRRLWMPMAIHFTWNFTLGGIWGTPVSGISEPGMFEGVLTGPALLTGGAFGIEASIITAILATGTGIIFILLSLKRGHFIPAPWRRPRTSVAEEEVEELAIPGDTAPETPDTETDETAEEQQE